MPTLMERWRNLQIATKIIFWLSIIMLILFVPIDWFFIFPNLLGQVITIMVNGFTYGIIAIIDIIVFAILYILFGIAELLVNSVIFVLNLSITAINTTFGGSLDSLALIDLIGELSTDPFFLLDPSSVSFSWIDIVVSSRSIFDHLMDGV